MKRRSFFALTAGAFFALAGSAAAHAMLSRAEPAVGATVRGPVTAVRLRFSERIEPALCRITLETANGHSIAAHDLTAEESGRVLVGQTPPLAAGTYRVRWRAVSVDTHVTEGDYVFTVAP
jgi:methionine-rich copper-binding protein CopC